MMDIKPGSRRQFLATGAAFFAVQQRALGQTLPHLNIGTSPIDGAMGLVSADHLGLFRKHGVDASIVISTGAANAAAVAGGTIQLAGSNLVTLIKAHLHGLPFQIVAPGDMYSSDDPTQVLVVRSGSSFHTAADLNGKTIATTSLGDVLAASTLAWIDQHGGTSSTVKMVELPPTALGAALENGRVDAATLAEPYLSDALATGSVVIFAKIFDAIAPKFLISSYFAMPDYINANRDTIQRFARAILDGNAYANENPAKTAPWLADFAKVDLASVRKARREVFATSMDTSLVQVVIDALVRMKAIDHGFPATDMISPASLNLHR
jgi:NitT/TauT family transport system substrate-binding protein